MLAVYSSVIQKLPQEKNNIKTVMLKLSMSQPVTITDDGIKMPKQKAEVPKEAPKAEAPAAKEPKPKKTKAKKEGAE
jgi:hypothetical protein